MLIFLDGSLIGSLAGNPSPHNPTAITIDLAAEAVRQGTHLICADVATFDALVAFSNIFNERTRSLLVRARKKSQFRRSLIEHTNWHLRITTNVSVPTKQIATTGVVEILIPPTTLASQSSLLQRPRFIPENSNDGYFFEALIYSYIAANEEYKNLFATVKLQFDLMQGGGSTTAQVYSHEKLSKNHFCLAVVDSDRTYPNGPLGSTASAVLAVDSPPRVAEWNARALVLGVRAIENLFPRDDLMRAASALDPILGETARDVVTAHAGREQWAYLPLKKGVRCFDVQSINSPIGSYLRSISGFALCPHSPLNVCTEREKCSHLVIASLGDKLLAQICKKPIHLNLDPIADAMLLPHIKQLCDEMISAFCGDVAAL